MITHDSAQPPSYVRSCRCSAPRLIVLVARWSRPAAADTPEAWEQAPHVSALGFLLVLLLIPLGARRGDRLLAVLPSMVGDSGYEPGQSWRGETEWFGGPRKGVEAADDGHPEQIERSSQRRRWHQWPVVTVLRRPAGRDRPRDPRGRDGLPLRVLRLRRRADGEPRAFAQRLHAALSRRPAAS